MEGLLQQQSETTYNIEKLIKNFRKESIERRTATAAKKIGELHKLFEDFHANHLILCKYEDQSSDYFTGQHYDSTKKYYNEALNYIQSFSKSSEKEQQEGEQKKFFDNPEISFRNPYPEKSNINNKLDEKLRKQAANYKALQRTLSNINVELIKEKWEFEDALKTLESRWSTIDSLHWEIESELEGRDNKEFEDLFTTYETKYNSLKKTINSKMWAEKHREKTTPTMEVPIFHGSYTQWTSFKDLFSETIHNNPSLSLAQKMQFLKSKVRGEAERLIQHLQISSDNYNICWEILNNRYNNKRLIFSTHINTILDLPIMKQQSLIHIKRMHDVTQECLNAIKNLGVDISTWDPLVVHILDQKLDTDSHTEYIDSLKDRRELPSLKDLLDFLEGKFTAMESSRRRTDAGSNQQRSYHSPQHNQNKPIMPSTSYGKFSHNQTNNNGNRPITKSAYNVTVIKCPLCNNEHGLYNCKKFLELPNEQQLKTAKELRVCINCLFSHRGNDCTSSKTCRKCSKKHNTILHDALNKSGSGMSGVTTAMQKHVTSTDTSYVSQHENNNKQIDEVLLATAMIKVKGADGTYHNMRALIDQGSQVSLITERAAQLLKTRRKHCKGTIFGVGEKENSGRGMLNIECYSILNDYKFQAEVVIMNNLIGRLPNKTFAKPQWSFIENISLADPDFYISRPVDILLGADIYCNIILNGIIRGETSTQPIVQQTKLGWLLCGSAKTYQCNVLLHNYEEIRKFWEVEEISEQSTLSVEEQKCITYYTDTTNRNSDGRYEVRLPLKEDIVNKLGSSKQAALAQFRNLEKKFQKQPKLADDYKTFMNEYKSLNHMKLHVSNNIQIPEKFLPHHGIKRISSTTTQYRVVFNASFKTDSGYSLNDLMYTGPNLQSDLQMLLLKWRQYQYAFTADIEKMFRMILINEEDQKYQQIFWRSTQDEPIQTYCLTTVTYGTRAAPFLAMMTLRKLAADEREHFPEASKVIETAFYMDDLLHGTDTVEEGMKLISDLISLMKSGGFNLRKWSSNEQALLDNLKSEKNNSEDNIFTFKTDDISKTLGLCWNSTKDKFTFQYDVHKTIPKTLTKRNLLSEISKLFDPLGWLAPLTTKLKILFQKLWQDELKWDDQVSEEVYKEWVKIKSDLHIINQFEVPRWITSRKNDVIELHGFCDASLEAYACVIYARVTGQSKTLLVAAKTKLVPHKKAITLPRLELSGAYLLSKLMKKVKEALSQHPLKIFGWSDSMVALGWIQGEPSRWKPFVANRVQLTCDVMPSTCWRYVKSNENPADAASRGLYAHQLQEQTLWWTGPTWLSNILLEQKPPQTYSTNQDIKIKQTYVAQKQEHNIIYDLINKYSSFTKVIRIVAWLLRTFVPTRKQLPRYLQFSELSTAKLLIIKLVQQNKYNDEIEALRKCKEVKTDSKLLNLNPFIDNLGVLRVGGRLNNANLNMEIKHPKIIPRDSRLAELLIDEAHRLTFHGGPRLTSANLRQQYWIPGGLNAVKKQLRKCVTCRKNNPTKQHQLMGDLPRARTEPAPPFYHTGVDYTGFVNVKVSKMRNARTLKGYIALFICMVTKAVHLELVTDLTSSAFLAALRRMSARRGTPAHLYSDCGTNFVGANRLLQQEYETLRQTFDDNLGAELSNMNIDWHFNCPSWPTAGGLWERLVRSLKHHLRRVIGEQRLTFEELSTILAQIEACLNSRPLCALTEHIEDLDILTPAHFLAGRAGLTVINNAEDARSRWHLTNQIVQQTWKKWKMEYLSQLNVRNKWLRPQRNLQIGDLVTVQDEDLPAGKWLMARVIALHPGRDGHTRVVSLKTKNGVIKRPVVKLCLLPLDSTTKRAENCHKDTNKGANENKTKKKNSTLYSVVMAVLFFMTLVSNTQGFVNNITELNNKQSLYFDPLAKVQLLRDEWTVVAYYDMSPYWDGTKALEKLQNYLEETCLNLEINNKCNMIAPQLRHEYRELQYYNQLLLTQHYTEHSRQRRGLINAVGYVANTLFGVLDQQFAEKYTRDIEIIKQNQAHLKSLWNNQTSVVESENNLVKRTQEIMVKQHKVITKHLNSLDKAVNTLQKEINKVNKEQEIALTAITANSILQSLRHIQNMMLDTISDIYQGQFNLHLLTPKQLQEQLNIISGQLTSETTLPIDNIYRDLHTIYKLMKIKARMTEKYFIFEIRIPLIGRETYDLYHVIPIPHLYTDNDVMTIAPISDYVAINLQKDSYLALSPDNLQKCISRDSTTYLCHPQHPIYKMNSDIDLCVKDNKNKCRTSIAACNDMWRSLAEINTYLYFCCKRCQLRTICGDQITAHQLSHANLIALNDDCVIKTNEFTIHGHKSYKNQINVRYDVATAVIAPINHIINLTIDKGMEDSDFNETEQERIRLLNEIDEKLKIMKQDETYETRVSYHDVHHYTLIYCVVAVMILAGVITAWRRVRRSWNAPIAAPTAKDKPPQPKKRRNIPRHRDSTRVNISDEETEMKHLETDKGQPIFRRIEFIEDSL